VELPSSDGIGPATDGTGTAADTVDVTALATIMAVEAMALARALWTWVYFISSFIQERNTRCKDGGNASTRCGVNRLGSPYPGSETAG
jgi:hypothetical protein